MPTCLGLHMAADVEGRQLYGTRIEKVNYQNSYKPQRPNLDTKTHDPCRSNVGIPIDLFAISRYGLVLAFVAWGFNARSLLLL